MDLTRGPTLPPKFNVIRLSKLLLKSFWIFAEKQRSNNKVNNLTNTSNLALKVIELELRTKGFNTGVVIRSVITDKPAELLLKTKALNNCRDCWCNVNTCMPASLMREAKRLFLQQVTRQSRFESPNDDNSFYWAFTVYPPRCSPSFDTACPSTTAKLSRFTPVYQRSGIY
jgi:hypothetical protein